MWSAEHSIETSASPEAVWRLWADVPELGPQISGDFPDVLKALAERVER